MAARLHPEARRRRLRPAAAAYGAGVKLVTTQPNSSSAMSLR
jgi:hypothetical protein